MSADLLMWSFGAVTAAIWGGLALWRLRVFPLVLAFVLANVCLNPLLLTLGGVSIDRIILAGLLVTYAWRRATGRIQALPFQWIDAVAAALLAWLVLSMARVGFTALGSYEGPIGRLINGYVLPLVVYWITRNVFDPRHDGRLLLRVLFGFGVYLAVTGICEYLQLWSLVLPPYVRSPKLGIHFGRARGPFLQAHSMGMWLTFGLVAGHGLLAHARGLARLGISGAMMAMAAGLAMTGTRSAWIGGAAAVTVLVGCAYRGLARVAALSVLAAAGLILWLCMGESLATPQRKGGREEAAYSLKCRQAIRNISWRMFLDRPVDGHGFGHYIYASKNYYDIADPDVPLSWARGLAQHSTFLSLLTETGLVGLGLFVALLAGWTLAGVRLGWNPSASSWQQALAHLFLAGMATYLAQAAAVEIAYGRFDNCLIGLVAGSVVAASAQRPGAPAVTPGAGGRAG